MTKIPKCDVCGTNMVKAFDPTAAGGYTNYYHCLECIKKQSTFTEQPILYTLKEERVMDFFISKDRKICNLYEGCDTHFSVKLNKKEMYTLAKEIKALADTMENM